MRDLHLPDEMSYLKIIPDFKCSRGCHYCYNVLLGQKTAASNDKVMAALHAVLEQTPRPVWIELIGGEPLELPARDLTFMILEKLQGHPRCAGTVLSTAVVSPALLSDVMPLLDRVYLSIDLSSSKQNRKRLDKRRLRVLVELFDSAKVELCVSGVLFGDESPRDLREFVEELVRVGIKSVGLSHRSALPLTLAEIDVAVGQYYELFRLRLEKRSDVQVVGTILDSIELHLLGGLRKGACECGRNTVVIEPNGQLTVGVCLDHRTDLMTLRAFRDVRLERPSRLLSGLCGDCALWDVCQGGCVSEAVRLHQTPFARASIHCEILRGVARRIEEDIRLLAP
jgi:radical SAM protein with 4Fe4S-binding SPASM domain